MRLIDPKVRKNFARYLFQCSLATLTILAALVFLDVLQHTAIVATLGATAFIVFTMPKAYSSEPRPLIGGYVVGISVGCMCGFLSTSELATSVFAGPGTPYVVFGAIAVGVAIFVMVTTNTEHPPAAGMSLGLVLNTWNYRTVAFVLGAVLLMALVRRLLRGKMMDLL